MRLAAVEETEIAFDVVGRGVEVESIAGPTGTKLCSALHFGHFSGVGIEKPQ